jgi:methionine-S-sulfoxide reductase
MHTHLLTILLLGATAAGLVGCAEQPSASATPAKTMNSGTNPTALATFGGGCFWCLEAVYELLPGVQSVVSGYAGGTEAEANYKAVCTGETGHAEVVQVGYDPATISFEKLLATFWHIHNPTTLNRQGNDIGPQYRSVIFYHDETQKLAAEKSRLAEQANWPQPIVTEIVPLTKFYTAEAYHQDYFRNNPNQGYCQVVIRPKVEKIEQELGIKK